MWKTLCKAFLEMMAPRLCPGCDLPVHHLDQTPFCGACAPLIEPAPEAFRPPSSSATLLVYGGPLAEAIRRLKYHGRTEFAPALGKILADGALCYVDQVDLVMPVPLYPDRLRARGYNQSALLARPVARRLGLPFDVMSLKRVRDTAEQASINKEQRALNVTGAFAARAPRVPARVLLIDDVRTTGATLAAASDALLRAGFSSVFALALAGAMPR